MPIPVAVGVVLLGLVLVGFGILAVEYPQAAYRLRQWPVAASDDALTTAGTDTERSLGYLWMLLGGVITVTGVVVLL